MKKLRRIHLPVALALCSMAAIVDPSAAVGAALPVVSIDDVTAPDIGANVVGLEIDERSSGGKSTIELRVSNFGARPDGTEGFLYFDDPRVAVGRRLEIAFDDPTATTFDGTIIALRGVFDEATAPRLDLIAKAGRDPAPPATPFAVTPTSFVGERPAAVNRTTATAVATDAAYLRPGALVTFSGVGPLFSGAFRVQSAVHTFDLSSGWRSKVALVRPGGRPPETP